MEAANARPPQPWAIRPPWKVNTPTPSRRTPKASHPDRTQAKMLIIFTLLYDKNVQLRI
jgi:hypothetical protein